MVRRVHDSAAVTNEKELRGLREEREGDGGLKQVVTRAWSPQSSGNSHACNRAGVVEGIALRSRHMRAPPQHWRRDLPRLRVRCGESRVAQPPKMPANRSAVGHAVPWVRDESTATPLYYPTRVYTHARVCTHINRYGTPTFAYHHAVFICDSGCLSPLQPTFLCSCALGASEAAKSMPTTAPANSFANSTTSSDHSVRKVIWGRGGGGE